MPGQARGEDTTALVKKRRRIERAGRKLRRIWYEILRNSLKSAAQQDGAVCDRNIRLASTDYRGRLTAPGIKDKAGRQSRLDYDDVSDERQDRPHRAISSD